MKKLLTLVSILCLAQVAGALQLLDAPSSMSATNHIPVSYARWTFGVRVDDWQAAWPNRAHAYFRGDSPRPRFSNNVGPRFADWRHADPQVAPLCPLDIDGTVGAAVGDDLVMYVISGLGMEDGFELRPFGPRTEPPVSGAFSDAWKVPTSIRFAAPALRGALKVRVGEYHYFNSNPEIRRNIRAGDFSFQGAGRTLTIDLLTCDPGATHARIVNSMDFTTHDNGNIWPFCDQSEQAHNFFVNCTIGWEADEPWQGLRVHSYDGQGYAVLDARSTNTATGGNLIPYVPPAAPAPDQVVEFASDITTSFPVGTLSEDMGCWETGLSGCVITSGHHKAWDPVQGIWTHDGDGKYLGTSGGARHPDGTSAVDSVCVPERLVRGVYPYSAPPFSTDLNCDGITDASDFDIFIEPDTGPFARGDDQGDFNCDGVTDAGDFSTFLDDFATGVPTARASFCP